MPFFSTATAKLEREHLAEEEWGYSILQVEVEGGKMGIQRVPYSSPFFSWVVRSTVRAH